MPMQNEFLKPDPNLLRPQPLVPLDASRTGATPDRESFAYKAASLSLYTPIALFLLGFCLMGPLTMNRGTATGVWIAILAGAVQLFLAVGAFVLAIVGLVGGCKRRAAQIIYLAIIGLVFNSGLLAYFVPPFLQLLKL
jgi:hypothetical protein